MKVCPVCSGEYPQGSQCPSDGATLVDKDRPDPLIGRDIKGMYRIESRLSDGGMSVVYVARQITLNRQVVIKVLRAGLDDKDFVQLFFREARVASQISHPNVVSIIDFGNTEDGLVFLVVELLRGVTLWDFVSKSRGLPVENIVWVMEQICAGVSAAHRLHVVHRDLKPSNVIIAQLTGGSVVAKLLDFGISKPLGEQDLACTRAGMVMGTPGYLAPEQIEGRRDIDQRADIYALGAILHFMATGHRPFAGEDGRSVMARQMAGEIIPLSRIELRDPRVSLLEPVMHKAMSQEPDKRYRDAEELLAAVHDAVARVAKTPEPAPEAATMVELPRDGRYQFIFYGEILQGHEPEAVKAKLVKGLGLKPEACEKLFSQKRVVVKRELSHELAKRYENLFKLAGAIGYIEDMDEGTRIAKPVPKTDVSLSRPIAFSMSEIAKPLELSGILEQIATQRPDPYVGSVPFSSTPPTPATPTPGTAPGVTYPSGITFPPGATHPSLVGHPGALLPQPTPMPTPAILSMPARKRRWPWLVLIFLLAGAAVGYGVPAVQYFLIDTWASLHGVPAARGVSRDRIVLGMSAAFAGSSREIGRAMQVGVEAKFREVNDAGGIHGRKLELMALNDSYEPEQTQKNIQRFLAPDGVFAVIGDVGTPTTAAVLPSLLNARTVIFGTLSGAAILRRDPPDRYVFNYRPSYAEETTAIIRYYVRERGLEPNRIGVFYQNDGYGKDGLAGVENALNGFGVRAEAIPQASYERNSLAIDNAAAGLVAKKDELQAMVVIGSYAQSARFMKLMRQAGFSGPIANVSFVDSNALADELAELEVDRGSGFLITQAVPMFDSHATAVLKYRDAMQRYYPGEDPGFVSLEGYVAASLFCEGLQRAGRTLSSEGLVNALETFRNVDLGIGAPISFSPSDHQGSHRVWGTLMTADGNFQALALNKEEQP